MTGIRSADPWAALVESRDANHQTTLPPSTNYVWYSDRNCNCKLQLHVASYFSLQFPQLLICLLITISSTWNCNSATHPPQFFTFLFQFTLLRNTRYQLAVLLPSQLQCSVVHAVSFSVLFLACLLIYYSHETSFK